MASGRPVFIGGCPRSGTTLVRSMLDSHPDLGIPHETRFLTYAYRYRARWGDMAVRENREQLAQWVVGRELSRHWRLCEDPAAIVQSIVEAGPTIGAALSGPFRLYAERQGKARWGDKRPALLLDLSGLLAMFPDAQYINVVRDPRAAVASIRRVGRSHGWDEHRIVKGAELWDRSQRVARRWQERLRADQFLEVGYERLVAEPRATLEEICAFLGLDPAGIDAMMAFHEHTSSVYSEKMHPLITKPVTSQAVRSWETELTTDELTFIEHALRREMPRYGYERVTSRRGPSEMHRRFLARRWERRHKAFREWRWQWVVRRRYRYPVAA